MQKGLYGKVNRATDDTGEPVFFADVSERDYFMKTDGIYKLTDTNGVAHIFFPDPSKFKGKTITLIGSGDQDTNISNENGFGPVLPNLDHVTGIRSGYVREYKSTGVHWYTTGT